MKEQTESGEYLAPQVKVIQMKVGQQILQDSGGINNMGWGSDQNGDSNF